MSQILDIEIILKENSNTSKKNITDLVRPYLNTINIRPNSFLTKFSIAKDEILHCELKGIIIGDIQNYDKHFIDLNSVEIRWHVYRLDTRGPIIQVECDGEEEELNIATHLILPSQDLFSLWESLYYDHNIKENLLKYAQTMMEFSDKGIDCNIVNCNRVILLHGPPGTGKTSLCKALAQKLTIRMQERYNSGILIEINSHSLFSKWFSESGKLVTKMFTKIKEIVENPSLLVCVLIDEVESLAHARNQCMSGTEPSDSIRVVNAILTQIDQIKRYSNVLIFTTSNMTEAIDLAFVDRADIKQFLGLPSVQAIFKVYYSCLVELISKNVVRGTEFLNNGENENVYTKKLLKVCDKSVGLSGRSLRKVPFIAHALFLKNNNSELSEFLEAMEQAVDREHSERKYFSTVKD